MPTSKPQILLADDERVLRQVLSCVLSDAGYDVIVVKNGAEALMQFRQAKPSLVLLDVMMPKMSGYEVCRRIRETDAETPILFLTALASEIDQLTGLGVGADDYICKTVSDAVLLARIASVLRRASRVTACGDFDFGAGRVDAAGLILRRAGVATALSERDVAVLRLFAERPGEVFTRDFLLTRFWPDDARPSDGALNVYFFGLREKLGVDGDLLVTVRGVGYVYRPCGK